MASKTYSLICVLILCCLLSFLLEEVILENSSNSELEKYCINSERFRDMDLSDIELPFVFSKAEEWNMDADRILTVLILCRLPFNRRDFCEKNQIIQKSNILIRRYPFAYEQTNQAVRSIFKDLVYFPVPVLFHEKETLWVNYVDSWGFSRTYGGERKHEGTDLMADRNERGLYPVLSVSDGTVEKMGWLEKGGWRIGIRGRNGAYFYYAHLSDYADVSVGDFVHAGQIIGFMGDTGYGVKEGTRGMFDVHLHFGIYLDAGEEEISVNPYWILKYLEKNVLTYDMSQKVRR